MAKQKSLGTVLRDQREALGLSLLDVARAVGLPDKSRTHILRLERDEKRPNSEMLGRLAKALSLDVRQLEAFARPLPTLKPYLRAKYDLDDEAIADVEAALDAVSKRHRKQGRK